MIGEIISHIRFIERISRGADNIWEWPEDGGKPRPLADFASEGIFAFSRDGKQLALHRGTVSTEVVLIKNFKVRGLWSAAADEIRKVAGALLCESLPVVGKRWR